ncbi:LeuA family protein [Thalassococcus sp. S3]|uniref:LeuA family protein n=1 Tax=Thalassococcus sp. S3 TaxID=2017482 RepID=UPI0010243096|nr:LeuA family protein [Thalassococcus sp. S3]QBF31392.1 hypothetical protein CFI11_09185 [Thalassococcus sp. S3]
MEIFETTLRDGEQQAYLHLMAQQKEALAIALEQLGVDIIDAGFPAASAVDLDGVRRIARATEQVQLSVLCRPVTRDIRMAHDAVGAAAARSRIATSARPFDLLARGPAERSAGFRKTRDRSRRLMQEARSWFPRAQYYLICAGDRDPSFLVDLAADVAAAGATHVVIADTLSTMEPGSFGALVKQIRGALPPDVIVGVHCHNQLGLSLMNSVAGIRAGAQQVEVTIGNTGDGGGNAALEQVLAYAHFFGGDDPDFANGCKMSRLNDVIEMFLAYSGLTLSPNKALIGEISFLVETGIHQSIPDHVKQRVFQPKVIGRATRNVIGRHSGRAGIADQLDRLRIDPARIDQGALYREVMKAAEQTGLVAEAEFRRIAAQVMRKEFCDAR